MTAIQRFKNALFIYQINESTQVDIFKEFENISDQSKKDLKAAFFTQAINYMDDNLAEELCHQIRDTCACSICRWRLKTMQKIAREGQVITVEEKLVSSLSYFFELYSGKGV